MRTFRFLQAKPLLALACAACACLTGSAVSARDAGVSSWQALCVSRCEQRFQACIAEGRLAPAVCESNRQGCLAVCTQ